MISFSAIDYSRITFEASVPDDLIKRAQTILGPIPNEPKDWLFDGCKRSNLLYSAIKYENDTIGFCAWHIDDRKALVVNALVSFAPFAAHSILSAGVEKIARLAGCKSIMGLTSRSGMVRQMQSYGYSACGVMLEKILK